MNSKNKSLYTQIFKSTFLFGFVQVFNILAKVGVNKAVAVFLGANGMGIIGLFQSTINILKTLTGLGISQSAVRDVSEANASNEIQKFSRKITITNKIIWATGLLGAIVTFSFSNYLSEWTFGNKDFVWAFRWLSIVVFLNIISEGQLAILKGMRQLRALAIASMLGSIIGLIAGVPLYYFFGEKGIIPSLIAVALTAIIFSWIYVRKIKYDRVSVSIKESISEGSGMMKMGIALMYISFATFLYNYIIRVYIGKLSSLEMVGIFQAGATIVTGYFGIIITAMSTDYYPRISAIHRDNRRLTEEVNKQSEVGLVLVGPLVVVFMFLMPFFIRFLYTEKFLISIDYISYAVFGTLIIICSNAMGMILIAKQKSKIFMISVTFSRIVGVIITIYSFKYYGLKGLGVSVIIMAVIHIILMQTIMYKLYNILFNKRTIILLIYTIILSYFALVTRSLDSVIIKYSIGAILVLISTALSIYNIKKIMNIDLLKFLRHRILKK